MKKELKKDLIQQVSNKMTSVWADEIPEDIMATQEGSDIIYSASLLTFFRVAKVLNIDLTQCYKHLEEYYLNSKINTSNTERDRDELN